MGGEQAVHRLSLQQVGERNVRTPGEIHHVHHSCYLFVFANGTEHGPVKERDGHAWVTVSAVVSLFNMPMLTKLL